MSHSTSFSSTKHVQHVIARAIACGMLLVLPSCAIPTLRLAKPGPDLTTSFKGAASAENSAQLGIHECYNDTKLTRLIDQALATNRELMILNEDVQIASNEVMARRGAYLPFLSFGASAGVGRHSDFTPEGAAEKELEYRPGKHFPDPVP